MQKWQIELYATPLWLLKTFGGVLLILAITLVLVGHTRFGLQFRQVLSPCLNKKSILKIVFLLMFMLLLLLTEVRLNVLSTFMTAGVLNALQDLNAQVFWLFVGMNAGVVLLRTFNNVINEFLDQALAIKWAEQLNQVLTSRWLAHKNYYRLQMRRRVPDNIDQRIQQDAQDFIANTIQFVRGMLDSVISSMEFAIVLWGLAGILRLFGVEIPKGLVFVVFCFVIVATAVAMWIGNPLIKLNYENERLNGDYRYSLIRVRNHAESVAFYAGETHEETQLSARFTAIIRNRWKMAKQSVFLSGFNDMFSQGVQLLPVILQAPRVFAREIKVGDVQQTVQVFARLQRALSFFRLFYEQFTAYCARLERLSGFLNSLNEPDIATQAQRHTVSGSLKVENLSLLRPDGTILLKNINFHLQSGESLLIQGKSGCGKTSLLRCLANLWAFGSTGHLHAPPMRETMFVPQRAYVPQGSLREAICYPHFHAEEADLQAILRDCDLANWADKLDEVKDWQHLLSGGELQKIAFARVLLARPKLILLDEASAALDETAEAHLYRLLREWLPESMMVSIGHRGTLAQFHQRVIEIAADTWGY